MERGLQTEKESSPSEFAEAGKPQGCKRYDKNKTAFFWDFAQKCMKEFCGPEASPTYFYRALGWTLLPRI